MLPIRHKSIFKSRWIALLWAGGILWTAIDVAGGRSPTGAGENAQAVGNDETADLQAAVNALDTASR